MNIERARGAVTKKGRIPNTCCYYIPQINLVSNLSSLSHEPRLEALYSSGTCFQIISVAEERLSTFCINLKTCISRHANLNDILTALLGW